jgi:hypothetical protein
MSFDASVFLRPDWILVGVPMSGPRKPDEQVMVIASNSLTQGELITTSKDASDYYGYYGELFPRFGPPEYNLTVKFNSFVMTMGANYADAVSALFRDWSPDSKVAIGEDNKAIEQGKVEIEP